MVQGGKHEGFGVDKTKVHTVITVCNMNAKTVVHSVYLREAASTTSIW